MNKLLRRIISIILILAIALLCSCGTDSGEGEPATSSTDIPVGITDIVIQERSSIELEVGESKEGYVQVFGEGDYSIDGLVFTCSDESVLRFTPTENNGSSIIYFTLVGVSGGNATLSVSTSDGAVISNEISVSVIGEGGSTTPSTTQTTPSTTATTTSKTSNLEEIPIEAPTGEVTYILNTNPDRMRFHETTCRHVKEIKPENYKEFYGTRDEAISLGFVPCGGCKP